MPDRFEGDFALYELVFRPAGDPPDDEVSVLASDGKELDKAYISAGNWYKEGRDNSTQDEMWHGVIGWADLPDASECIQDLLKI